MAKRARRRTTLVANFVCPICGSDVQVGALACRECGSDAETGWSEDTLYDGLDLPLAGNAAWEEEAAFRSSLSRKSSLRWLILASVVVALLGLPTCF